MAKYDSMVNAKKHQSTEKLVEISRIITDIKKSGAKFDTLTKYAKEVAIRLKASTGQGISSTSLLRSNSPYRPFIHKGFSDSCNPKLASASPEQTIVGLQIEMRMKNEELEKLKGIIDKQMEKYRLLQHNHIESQTDKLESKFSPHEEVFVYIKAILDYVSEPDGLYRFDGERGELSEPMSSNPILNKFPEGFLEWLRNQKNKKK